MNELVKEMIESARRALDENVRHSRDSLFAHLGRLFPEATDDEIDDVVKEVL